MKKTSLLCIAFILSIGFVVAQDGTYDTSFGDNGVVYTDIDQQIEVFYAVAQSPSGKIAVAGESLGETEIESFIVMYLEDGTIDTSFADNGFLREQSDNEFENIDFQSNGKLLVYGNFNGFDKVARLLPNGTLDTTFADNGYMTNGSGTYLMIDVNDRILTTTTQNGSITLMRYLPDGALDTSFGTNGSIVFVSGANSNISLKYLENGKLLIYYNSTENGNTLKYIARFMPDGSLDLNFGTNGRAELPIEDFIGCKIFSFNDESILVSCSGWNPDTLDFLRKTLKLTAQGDLDTNFSTNGVLNGKTVELIQQNQRFITNSGPVDYEGGTNIVFRRFFNNGDLDTTFQFEPAPEIIERSFKSMITNSGKLLIAANNMGLHAFQDILLFQYNNNPLSITNKNTTSIAIFPNPSNGIFNLKSQEPIYSPYTVSDINGRILLTGTFEGIENELDLSSFSKGVYFLNNLSSTFQLLVK